MNPPNPKQRYGDLKVALGLFPSSALVYGALGMMEGAAKYGAYNWRDKAVEAMTYVHAAERHLRAWLDGEELATDSGKPHLGHAISCLAILVDAIEQGNLIDNRPLAGGTARLLEKWAKPADAPAPVNGADVLGMNEKPVSGLKRPCPCRDLDRCCADDGIRLGMGLFCRKAEDADRTPEPYSKVWRG